MRRVLLLVLALTLCIFLTACGGKGSPVVGTWQSTAAGGEFVLILKADGTGTVQVDKAREKIPLLWQHEDCDLPVQAIHLTTPTGEQLVDPVLYHVAQDVISIPPSVTLARK